MIGVFDSGVGGLTALKELRKIAPNVNICFLADRKNAPYGTKTIEDIVKLSKNNIEKLLSFGAQKILMACCTASASYGLLSEKEKRVCIPIIKPAASRAVALSRSKRIGVIATERTVRERAFSKAITELSKDATVFEFEAQPLVTLVENGARDFRLNPSEIEQIKEVLSPLKNKDIDILILGCTHFPHIKLKIEEILGVPTVNPSLEGALMIAEQLSLSEEGRTVYL